MSEARPGVPARARRGGVLVRVDGAIVFVPASAVVRVSYSPRITRVPGAAGPPELLGVTLHEGVVVPVVAIGAARYEMIVCQHGGELVGLIGGEVVVTGTFDAAETGDAVEHEGRRADALDLAAIYDRVQAGALSGRRARA